MRRTVAAVVAVVFVHSALSLAGVPVIANPLRSSDLKITAVFPRTVGLYPDSDVNVLGIKAGTVTDVVHQADRVEVHMDVKDVDLAPDATATIRLKSMIGSRYVELSPVWSGEGPRLEDGAVIPMERTAIPVEVSEFLDEGARVADAIDAGAMSRVIEEWAKALGGRRDDVAALTTSLSDLGGTLSARSSELDASLVHLRDMVSTLAAQDGDVVRILRSSNVITQALLAQQGALDGAITGLDDLLGTLADFTADQKGKLVEATDRLGRIGRILSEHEEGWQRIIDLSPYYGYGWSRAIHHDGNRWYIVEQPQGLAYVPYHPFMHPMNERGGPGADHDDHTVYPGIDWSCSPLRPLIPWQIDLTGPTGPGPLLPEQNIGDGFIVTSNEPGQAYASPGHQGTDEREPPPPAPPGGRCDNTREVKVG